MPARKTIMSMGAVVLAAAAALGAGSRWVGKPARPSEPALPTWTAPFDRIAEAYGPTLYSQGSEETLIRAYFRDRKGGFFLDVGASHFQKDSTTYYLEKHLGWQGIAVDALEEFRGDYEQFRKGTRFFAFFVTNEAGAEKDFYRYARDTRISSGSLEHLQGLPRVKGRHIEKVEVPSVTLDQLLESEQVEKIDFVSMDIEGSEPRALEGFDIDRYQPELLCVETQTYTRDWILEYFASHGYDIIEPYREPDPVNLYFRRRL
jgi:FkbM family methyltransferase